VLNYFLAGGGLRLSETIIYSSIWIVIGCLIAAVFRRMLGAEKVRQMFANDSRWGLVAGWLIGMLLPVCSLGVIPVVRELHRAGIKRGTIVAFGLTAPLFNPMSVLYGLTLSDPIAILSFSLCALAIVSFLGFVWDRWSDPNEEERVDESLPTPGIKRSVAVIDSTSRELIGPTMYYVAIGIVASVVLAVLIPKGYLQNQVDRDNMLAPITVALIATPVYSSPLLAMSQIGGMFQHGNSIGAAFSLLILGAGTNLGLLAWFGATYGAKRVVVFYLLLVCSTVGLAYTIDKPLYPKGVEPAGHTHAFDVYTHPFTGHEPNIYEQAKTSIGDFWVRNEFGATYLMIGLAGIGIAFLAIRRRFDLENWLIAEDKQTGLNREVPGWILGMTSVIGLVAASVVGCYLYYPAPESLLGDLSIVNTECVLCAKNKDWEAADKWIGYSDDLSRRLEVGVFLRQGSVPEFQSMKAKIYRQRLDELKEFVDLRNENGLGEKAQNVADAYLRLSSAFKKLALERSKNGMPY
jgi:uncharacterized membrane protein YraQ (UPF0718 family)